MQVFFKRVCSCCSPSKSTQITQCVAEMPSMLPSPTKNCHSGPVGFDNVLFVSIKGTGCIPAPYGPPMVGYRGGGGRTLKCHGVSLCQAQAVAGSMRSWDIVHTT